MRAELIRIATPTHPLDGVYYKPEGSIKGAVMYCHGNQMNFYVCAARFLAPHVAALGYAFLAFNRRGHDSVSTFNSREPVGGAYQTVAEGIEDNELAAKFLANEGFNTPIIVGHSNGGVLASEHVARHPETPALVLLSAHAGGNRLNETKSVSRYTNNERIEDLIKEAEMLLAAGKPRQLMLLPTWWYVISARTFMDRLTHVPNLIANAARIRCPVLFIRGDQEPAANYPAEAFKERCTGPCEIAIISDCDHFYAGAEDRVSKTVTDWLAQTIATV